MKALTAINLVILGLLGWFVITSTRDDTIPLIEEAVARAKTLEAADRFSAAALAWHRASRAGRGAEATALLDSARAAEAMAVVSAAELPPAAQWPGLRALADDLAAAGAEHALAADLLRLTVLRAEGRRAEAVALADTLGDARASPWVDWHLGAIRLGQVRAGEAIEHLERLARARPTFGPGMHRLGLAYAAADRAEAATEALQRAAKYGAGPDAEVDLGKLFLQRKMWAEALPHLENALRAQPASAEVLRLIAAAQFHLDRPIRAAQTYRKAYSLEREPRTLLSAAIALNAGKKHEEALRVLESLLPQAADLPEIYFQKAIVEAAAGRAPTKTLERYLAAARGRDGEAERIEKAETALKEISKAAPPKPAPPADPPGHRHD